MTEVRAADLPDGSIVAALYQVWILADRAGERVWHGTDKREMTDGQVQRYLDIGATVLRHGHGDEAT